MRCGLLLLPQWIQIVPSLYCSCTICSRTSTDAMLVFPVADEPEMMPTGDAARRKSAENIREHAVCIVEDNV